MPTPQEVWAMLQAHEGETFYTAKGLPFHYLIHGRELFVNRKNKSITISTFIRCFYNWASSICRRQTTNHCNKLQAHNRLHNLLCAFCMFCTKIGQNE